MNPLYNAGIALYRTAAHVAACRSDKVSRMLRGQASALDDIARVRQTRAAEGFDYWFHAASLGEFEQARPLIEAIRRRCPNASICLSFFSPSGYEVRKDYSKVDCVVYLPFDTPSRARTFVDAIAPRTAIFVKYEFWGNILQTLFRRNVPTLLISSIFRPGQIFFKPWGGQFRRILRCFSKIYVQDEDSQRLLRGIGLQNITVAGDTRFDRVTDIMAAAKPLPAVDRWLADSPFTLIVGSSWPQDEERYIPWLNANHPVRAIVAPHEFDNKRIARLAENFDGRVMLWSQLASDREIPADTQILIIDTFGLLSSLYRYGHAAIIGGGFGAGIHNINEAAVYGIPVIFGPNNGKFREAAGLIGAGGGFQYEDAASLKAILDSLSGLSGPGQCNPGLETFTSGQMSESAQADAVQSLNADNQVRISAGQAAARYIQSHLGATNHILRDLFPS